MNNDNHYDYFTAKFEGLKSQLAIEERREKAIRFATEVINRVSYLLFGAMVGAVCIWIVRSFCG